MQAWYLRLSKLYGSYSKSADERAATLRELFAPEVRRFLGLSDVSVDQVIAAVDQFFLAHPNPYYFVKRISEASSHPGGVTVRARVNARWEEKCPEEREAWRCRREPLLDVRVEADAEGRIVELVESRGPKEHYRALVDRMGYDGPRSECDDRATRSSTRWAIDISKGTIVEATGRVVSVWGCGPCEEIRQYVHAGVTFWAVTLACFRFDDDLGPHTDSESFLELVE